MLCSLQRPCREGEDAPAVVEVGARIRAFYYTQADSPQGIEVRARLKFVQVYLLDSRNFHEPHKGVCRLPLW